MEETPDEYYRELERLGFRFEEMGYTLLEMLEAYEVAGEPFGHAARGFVCWVRYSLEGGARTSRN